MLVDKNAILQIFGSILKDPSILDNSDRYIFDTTNFTSSFERGVFSAIYNLHKNGASQIAVVDVCNYLEGFPSLYTIFEKENGIEYLNDAIELSQPENFEYYYNRFKKFNLLRDLRKMGYNTNKIYSEDLTDEQTESINKKFDTLTTEDIITKIQNELGILQTDYNRGRAGNAASAYTGLADLVSELKQHPEVGTALQGDIFNTVCRGARRGKLYIRSGSSGSGKTRNSVGDACFMAFPFRYNPQTYRWETTGQSEKILYIATEQEQCEIQTLIIAYLTGFNEEKILTGTYDAEEEKIINQAIRLVGMFRDNFIITQIADPDIAKIKSEIRKAHIEHNMTAVFYDYIFSSPALLNEFRDLRIREDVALMMLTTALKDIAVELNLFIMTSTQLSGEYDKTQGIKNQTLLRGSKSIIDKGDIGCIMLPISEEERVRMKEITAKYSIEPNMVTDIYKNRRGHHTNIKIWSYVDLGTCKKTDLFVTNGGYEILDFDIKKYMINFDFDRTFLETLPKDQVCLKPVELKDVEPTTGEIKPSYYGIVDDLSF